MLKFWGGEGTSSSSIRGCRSLYFLSFPRLPCFRINIMIYDTYAFSVECATMYLQPTVGSTITDPVPASKILVYALV